MQSPLWFRLHLTAIVAVAGVCCACLVVRAHAGDFTTFGDLRRSVGDTRGGMIYPATPATTGGGAGVPKTATTADVRAILEAVPGELSLRKTRNGFVHKGNYLGQVYSSGREGYFNIIFGDRTSSVNAEGVNYEIEYGPEVAARIKAAIDRAAPPPAQPK